MTHEEKMEKFREKCKIVAAYINYLGGKTDAN